MEAEHMVTFETTVAGESAQSETRADAFLSSVRVDGQGEVQTVHFGPSLKISMPRRIVKETVLDLLATMPRGDMKDVLARLEERRVKVRKQ